MRKLMIVSICLLGLALSACDTLLQVANEMANTSTTPTEFEMGNGLKAALEKGAGFAVSSLSAENGYFNNPLVKIPFPQEAQFAADALNSIGLGSLVTEFEKLLNKGAEEGAKMALPIFTNAIKQMTFADVKNILFGGENAATNYFKEKTTVQLTDAFSPHIKTSLDQVNATKIWTDITNKYNSIPFTNKKVETDLVKYATGKALDGLFLKVAEEEAKIRKDPIARTSELLRKVFGYAERNG